MQQENEPKEERSKSEEDEEVLGYSEEEIRKQFEEKRRELEERKKMLESKREMLLRQKLGTGKEVQIVSEMMGGSAKVLMTRKNGNEGGGAGTVHIAGSEEKSSGSDKHKGGKVRLWKDRQKKVTEESKGGKKQKQKSRSARATSRVRHDSSSDEESDKCNSYVAPSSERDQERVNVMTLLEKYYGKKPHSAIKSEVRFFFFCLLCDGLPLLIDEVPLHLKDSEAFPGIRMHTELEPPSAIVRAFPDQVQKQREKVQKKWMQEQAKKLEEKDFEPDSLSVISSWQMDQLKKTTLKSQSRKKESEDKLKQKQEELLQRARELDRGHEEKEGKKSRPIRRGGTEPIRRHQRAASANSTTTTNSISPRKTAPEEQNVASPVGSDSPLDGTAGDDGAATDNGESRMFVTSEIVDDDLSGDE
jgi:hypothetical protein